MGVIVLVVLVGLILFIIVLNSITNSVNSFSGSMREASRRTIAECEERQKRGGVCPYCRELIFAPNPTFNGKDFIHVQAFDCPICTKRIVVRDTDSYPNYEFEKLNV